jgi:hypothetical protein
LLVQAPKQYLLSKTLFPKDDEEQLDLFKLRNLIKNENERVKFT